MSTKYLPLVLISALIRYLLTVFSRKDWRLRNENAGLEDHDPDSMLWGLKQAIVDPKLYMFVLLQMALITSQSFNNFFPSIVGTLGYNNTNTLLLTAPPYGFAFVCSLAVSFHAAYREERGYHIAVPLMFALLGNLLVCMTLIVNLDSH